MMKHAMIPIVLLCVVWVGAATAETVRQKEQREAFQNYLETKLRDVNRKLDGLSKRTANVREESRPELRRQMEELPKKREALNRKLADLKSASVENWDRLKAETNAAIDELNTMHDRISSLLK